MSETAINEDSLKGLMIERLKAVHVEVTDISGTSVVSCVLFSMFVTSFISKKSTPRSQG